MGQQGAGTAAGHTPVEGGGDRAVRPDAGVVEMVRGGFEGEAVAWERLGRPLAVVSSLPSDSHTWNLVFLQLLLEEQGFEVSNLGACVPVGELADTCLVLSPDLVVLSSVNGHGYAEASSAIRVLRSTPGLEMLPVVIGGKLTTQGRLTGGQVRSLVEDGFDVVFPEGSEHAEFCVFARQFLAPTRVRRALATTGSRRGR